MLRRGEKRATEINTNTCFYCGREFGSELPYKCHYCGEMFCSEHRLPENHLCVALPRRSWMTYKERKARVGPKPITLKKIPIVKSFGFLVFLILPFGAGLAFVYLLTPGMADFANLVGTKNTLFLLSSAFLFPFESKISWLAWIVSGFVGGLILRRVLIPFLFTYGLGWLVFYIVGREQLEDVLVLIGGKTLTQIIALNAFVALLAFSFGGFIGSTIRR